MIDFGMRKTWIDNHLCHLKVLVSCPVVVVFIVVFTKTHHSALLESDGGGVQVKRELVLFLIFDVLNVSLTCGRSSEWQTGPTAR